MSIATTCFIGLGSNLSDPLRQLQLARIALAQIPHTQLTGFSPLYRSAPVGPAGQGDYINAVAQLETHLPPESLLDALQAIENQQGRERGERWGPRTLDLDLLLYGDQVIDTPRLQVPHPQIAQRNFVLVPLLALAPEMRLPSGPSLASLLRDCPAGELQRLTDEEFDGGSNPAP